MEKIDWMERSLSTTGLAEGKKSTRDLLAYWNKPKDSDKASHFDFGSALELYIFDIAEFNKKVVIMDESKRPVPDKNYQTKANAEWKTQFYVDNADKYIIPTTGDDSFEVITTLESMFKKHPEYARIMSLKGIQSEYKWVCPYSGLNRYSRTDLDGSPLDGVLPAIIIDVKTDAGNDPQKAINNNDYWIKAYDQLFGAAASGRMGEDVSIEDIDYYWLFFGKKAPYFVDFVYLHPANREKLEDVYQSTLRRIGEDLRNDPENIVSHGAAEMMVSLPGWYR